MQWRLRTSWRIVLLLAVLLGTFAKLSLADDFTQTVATQHYTVQLRLDQGALGDRTATIAVTGQSGQLVVADEVVLTPIMPIMGIPEPELSAQSVAPGRYIARGEIFTMAGTWSIDVRARVATTEETARFTFDAS